jgi:hypothetical protein
MKFFKCPDAVKLESLKFEMFDWIDLTNFWMKLIEFNANKTRCEKFVTLSKHDEETERKLLEVCP